jgi:acetyl esterase/lipase
MENKRPNQPVPFEIETEPMNPSSTFEKIGDQQFLDLLHNDPGNAMGLLPEGVTMLDHIPVGMTDTGFLLEADVFHRTEETSPLRPALIFLHDWACGKNPPRAGERQCAYFALEHDFVSISLYYRPPQSGLYPSALKDVRTCARWLRSLAGHFCIDPQRIIAMGSSAGTQWAFLAAAANGSRDFEEKGLHENWSGNINLVLLNAAICDLVNDFQESYLALDAIGASFAKKPDVWHRASPIENIRPGLPPVFMVHGDRDLSCPIASARSMVAKLEASGCDAELLELPGRAHGSDGFTNDIFMNLEKMASFANGRLDWIPNPPASSANRSQSA